MRPESEILRRQHNPLSLTLVILAIRSSVRMRGSARRSAASQRGPTLSSTSVIALLKSSECSGSSAVKSRSPAVSEDQQKSGHSTALSISSEGQLIRTTYLPPSGPRSKDGLLEDLQ